ncbi:quaternary amine ABC transporter ATP-binding protein [Nonomuraea basaltis]|uniref:quaternary amine ABC transporter ATP-binding protein n=1 Tax=Nonomuraea basaltis TaxID=2495887 RepID=UPI00110C6F65|nr:betaine/proline/choline family ABC transporter ATP-binding protein [Nonomuraea basaltis]TMR90996.1 betaine/proline/choline family ABC transporter ATP-binding protein [Nonomuraea basaltis]
MIEAKNLTKVYGIAQDRAVPLLRQSERQNAVRTAGGFLAVDKVSFSVSPGEIFVIMGLSGSGKSTVLRMLNRLVEPTEGSVRIDGVDVSAMRQDELLPLRNRKINMVFQHFALLPHRTIRQNAAYGLKIRQVPVKERLERADWALQRVGLEQWGDSYPHELSGGMKQRVGLARALATDAEILLMDEPFSALDPLIRRDMQELLLQLQAADQRTIVFVTHDLNEAMRIGDRIMVMRNGQVVQCATGTEIISEPADEYVSEFIADVDRSRVLTAASVLRAPLVTARWDESPGEVLQRLENVEMNGIFVLDETDRILGVATDEALARALREGETTLDPCLVGGWHAVSPDLPIVEFCDLAGRHTVPVAVVDDDKRLLGVAPRAAILAALAAPKKVKHA